MVPTVSSVAITSATGAQSNYLNAGDVVTATATFSEAVTVDTTGGRPYLNLNINGTTLQAAYASGSGTTALTFSYTILAGQTDANGISIATNSLSLNSGTIKDASGNNATLTHTAVSDNASFMVDTTAPTATLTTGTYANTASATVQSSETGAAYLVNNTIIVTNEASITSASGTSWNSVAISAANTNTSLALTGLVDGSYKLYTVDAAGNLSTASTNTFTVNAAATSLSNTITQLLMSSDTGSSPTDKITKTTSQTISGTLSEALGSNESVYISADGGLNWSSAIASSGGTSFNLSGLLLEVGTNNSMQAKVMNTFTSSSSAIYSILYTLDTTAPTVAIIAPTLAITSSKTAATAGESLTLTFTFSEVPVGFSASDITVTNGTVSGLTVDATNSKVYTATLALSNALSSGTSVVSVASNNFYDVAGNANAVSSSLSVTIDSVVPTVSSVAIASATGATNNTLNAGDVVIATATFTEAVTVVTTGGTPYLNLNIGGTTVQAAYASGSGTTALTFTYTVLSGQTDANGISIDLNSLNLNSGTIKDAAGNSATITNTAVTDNASYMVDTTKPLAPTLALGSGVSDGATSTEAKQSSGVVTVSAETGASTVVTFSRIGGGTVTKTVTGTGSPMGVSLLDADLTTLGIGTINVTAVATDLAGNASNSATSSFTYDNYVSPAGNAVINLNSYGNLIAPVQVEGSWYYYWDRSGDGVWGAADRISYFTLNGIFTSSTVTLNGVQVALPSLTISVANENRNQAGTSYSDAGSTTNGTSSATYDSLLAIWDAYNGTGTGTNISGVPTNWAPNNYWSSTYKTNNNGPLNYITLNTGYVGNDEDNALMYAALRVLPIVVDLNHDGSFNYSNVVMDVNGDGLLDATRWVGGQDGVLVWNKYHDGLVHDNSQYAFAQYDNMSAAQGKTATDLSGLAAAFDTNHDGVFDVQDAQFADFNVWQDANQDGVSDAGEVKTLAELGLSSFQLSSDGVARTPEVGVHEAGRTSASATDGSQVLVADVGFDFGTLAKLDLSADPVANTLALHLDDLLANPHLTLVVQGAANDAVKLQGDGWVNSGSTVTLGDHHYTVWNNSTAQLLIDQQLVNNGRVL